MKYVQDTDQVIRLRPPPAPDAPSSPEYVPSADTYDDHEYLDDDDDDNDDDFLNEHDTDDYVYSSAHHQR